MRNLFSFLVGALWIPLTCAAARADDASDASRAALLFAEGRRLMAAGDYAAACPKLADSLALDQQADAALDLSTCYERSSQQALAIARALAPVAERRDRGTPSEGTESSESESPGRSQRVTGLVVGGVGVAGVVGGVIAELIAMTKRNELDASCAGSGCPSIAAAQVNLVHDLYVAADVSIAAGLAAVSAGAIVFFTAPKDRTVPRPSVGVAPTPHGAAVSLGAVF